MYVCFAHVITSRYINCPRHDVLLFKSGAVARNFHTTCLSDPLWITLLTIATCCSNTNQLWYFQELGEITQLKWYRNEEWYTGCLSQSNMHLWKVIRSLKWTAMPTSYSAVTVDGNHASFDNYNSGYKTYNIYYTYMIFINWS